MTIKMHCEGCVSDLEFTSPNNVASLAARDELAAINFWQSQHTPCQQSMLALRESAAQAAQPSQAPAYTPPPEATSGSPSPGMAPPTVTHAPAGLPVQQPPASAT